MNDQSGNEQSGKTARIFITGASSGIGATLAQLYAQQYSQNLHLGLVARRSERLVTLAENLRELGGVVETYTTDVRDGESMAEVCQSFIESAGGVDLAIANAGISLGERAGDGDPQRATDVIATNVQGVINTILPMIPAMMESKAGHLVAIGSVAGFRGLPGKGAYCASKAAVKTFMDAYRPVLRPHGIQVSTICPGFVATELTAKNPYPMPFMMNANKAAGLIAAAITKGRKTYIFPWQMRLVVPLMRILPDRMLPGMGARK